MNDRQRNRNIGRIPRLVQHIERAKERKQPKRVKGFEAELERRKAEMTAAGHGELLKKLLGKNGLDFALEHAAKLAEAEAAEAAE